MPHTREPPPAYLELTVPGLDHDRNLELIVSKQSQFSPSTILVGKGAKTEQAHGYDRRNSLSLEGDPEIAVICGTIELHITARIASILEALDVRPFRLGNTTASCVCFRNGSFFHRHRDVVKERAGKRQLTWVYYLNSEPKKFSGGDLVLYRRNHGRTLIETAHGKIVIFRSRLAHEVTTVSLKPDDFCDARFTLTGFISDQATLADLLRFQARQVRIWFRQRGRKLLAQ